MFRAAVAGASGYAGGELLRILADHPRIEIVTVTGHASAGDPLIKHQPHLRSLAHLRIQETSAEVLDGHDIVFFALPHGASARLTKQLVKTPLVVDCGADHRLVSPEAWERFYGSEHSEPWTYGVPELLIKTETGEIKQRERLRDTKRIAAPGCNASTVALAITPGVAVGIVDPDDTVATLAVGPSGAGKSAKTELLAAEIMGSAHPYAVGGVHRHIPEIQQSLEWAGAKPQPRLCFTPVLVPMSRGILATVTAPLKPGVSPERVREVWESAYRDDSFVTVLPEGVQPRTADVVGSNSCVMSVQVDQAAGRVVVVAAIDNLVKGTAGAAVQSVNIALGIPETTGLQQNGVAP